MRLWKRVLLEKRSLVIPLVLAAILNIAAYVLIVYPLGVKSVGAAGRAAAAARTLNAAEQEVTAARALVTGRSRAEQELSTFYDKVLPADLPAARRLTYASLPALARKTNVKFLERQTESDPSAKSSRIGLLTVHTRFQGDYENLRQFIFELESAPEFVIIDDVALAQSDVSKPLTLTLQLSTYYRLRANGT